MIIVSMCTIPVRKDYFLEILTRILSEQTRPIDQLHVWLNGYAQLPAGFPADRRLQVHLEPSNPGPWVRYQAAQGLADGDIFVTLDDDLIYPTDYIERGVEALIQQSGKTSVCFGGVFWDWVVPSDQLDYHPHKRLITSPGSLSADCQVPVLMGGAGFHYAGNVQNVISMELPGFATNDDLMASYHLQRQGVTILSLAKAENWIGEHPYQSSSHALNRRDLPTRIETFRQLVRRLGFIPWSVDANAERLRPACLVISGMPIADHDFSHLQALCVNGESLHTLEVIAGGLGAYTSRPIRNGFEHFVSVPEPGGRFSSLPGVQRWRQRRVESQGWEQVQQYLGWLKASLNIQKVSVFPSTREPVWLVRKLQAWVDDFCPESILQILGTH
jgi:hypothetical protein